MEEFTICNKYFTSLATQAFKNLLDDENFSDVKLLTSDDKQIKAHKVVLGSSSNFFKKIFCQNTDNNLIIYLKGISYKELSWMMNFIYIGRCKVEQSELDRFLSIGKELEVEGIQDVEKQNDPIEYDNDIGIVVENLEDKSGRHNFVF